MTETFQDQKAIETTETADINFATIGDIFADGVTLIFDGQTEATEKHYKCNSFEVFSAGQRVKIVKDSGTYVVEYPVGNPRTSFTVDTAATANNALKLNGKAEGSLAVQSAGSADRSNIVINQSYPAYTSYDIQFKTDSSGYFIRSGAYGTWKKITVT